MRSSLVLEILSAVKGSAVTMADKGVETLLTRDWDVMGIIIKTYSRILTCELI